MSTLTERVGAALEADFSDRRGFRQTLDDMLGEDRAELRSTLGGIAIRVLLAALREPSEAMAMHGGNEVVDGCPSDGNARDAWRAMLDAFAREHGLDQPPAEEQQP